MFVFWQSRRVNFLCTFSIDFISPFALEDQLHVLYSTRGLIYILYRFSSSQQLLLENVRSIEYPKVVAFALILSMYVFHCRLFEIVIPKSLTLFTLGIGRLFIVKMIGVTSLIVKCSDFLPFRRSCQVFTQDSTMFSACCKS